jgi:hypothetical protein
MPGRYRIGAEIDLNTEIEPEGYFSGVDDSEGVTEVIEESNWDRNTVEVRGGRAVIMIEADSEEEAVDLANTALDSAYWNSSDGYEWEIEDYRITDIECIEEPVPPMDLERALVLIRAYVAREVAADRMDPETGSAFSFMLDRVTP